jgi:hypothetical protein
MGILPFCNPRRIPPAKFVERVAKFKHQRAIGWQIGIERTQPIYSDPDVSQLAALAQTWNVEGVQRVMLVGTLQPGKDCDLLSAQLSARLMDVISDTRFDMDWPGLRSEGRHVVSTCTGGKPGCRSRWRSGGSGGRKRLLVGELPVNSLQRSNRTTS